MPSSPRDRSPAPAPTPPPARPARRPACVALACAVFACACACVALALPPRPAAAQEPAGLPVAVAPDDDTSDDAMSADAVRGDETSDEEASGVVGTASAEETAEEAALAEDDDAPARPAVPARPSAAGPALVVYGLVHGEWELRFDALSVVPLPPLPGQPETTSLGQRAFTTHWFRLRGELGLRPHLRLVLHADLLRGVLFGDTAQGIAPSAWRRDRRIGFDGDDGCAREARCERQSAGFALRQLYLEWTTRAGVLRVGQQGFHWGLGVVANDGDRRPYFGDAQSGDLVERASFVARPFGPRHPLAVGVAADLVYDEGPFDLRRGDTLAQGVLSVLWQQGEGPPVTAAAGGTHATVFGRERALGAFLAVRSGRDRSGARLDLATLDLYARWDVREPGGGRVFAAFEGAYTLGTTELSLAPDRASERVAQLVWAAQVGRSADHLDAFVEAGYAGGDARATDGVQRRGALDGDHRVGLVLFPEVLNWLSARSVAAALPFAGDDARALAQLPTSGGVAGAMYLAPTLLWRPKAWLELRLGAVVARTSAANVDPIAERRGLGRRNVRGGDAEPRDLGLELDAALLVATELRDRVTLTGGVEGGVLFPGRAFDDARGAPMADVGLVRARVGLRW